MSRHWKRILLKEPLKHENICNLVTKSQWEVLFPRLKYEYLARSNPFLTHFMTCLCTSPALPGTGSCNFDRIQCAREEVKHVELTTDGFSKARKV